MAILLELRHLAREYGGCSPPCSCRPPAAPRSPAAGGAVVYSSHVLEVVEKLCSRVAILHQGQLAALGSPRQLMESGGDESLSRLFLRLTGNGR